MGKSNVIACINQKGGTGKSATAENLGIGLANEGKKVLLIDLDPQGSLTISLGYPQPDEIATTVTDIMNKIVTEKPISEGEGILHNPEGVDLLPARSAGRQYSGSISRVFGRIMTTFLLTAHRVSVC